MSLGPEDSRGEAFIPVRPRNGSIEISTITGDAASRAFFWTAAGGMVDLGTLAGSNSEAVAVNGTGQVAGQSFVPEDVALHAALWQT
jgi:probable HAF family extracellular repeat protein